jgi:SAM-dependent methyltransferase
MVGKMILPSLGGAASVWTTCVLFFQGMLLAGYFYAHLLGKVRNLRLQFAVHLILMAGAFAFLPIRFGDEAPPAVETSPVVWLLLQLLRQAALPFFVVSATAPLLQGWFSRTTAASADDPYFLYASSNAGSLFALLLYPFILEPALGVTAQSRWWSIGYFVLLGAVAACAAAFQRSAVRKESIEEAPTVEARTRAYWLAAAFVPSALMLAATAHLSINLASVPFLWTLPLAVYLLTFILAFGRNVRVSAERISALAPALLLLLFPIFSAGTIRQPVLYMGLLTAHLLLLFVGGLLCHTALAHTRPKTPHLTEYYAWIALGGVLGGVFAAVIAPLAFDTVLEYPLLAATLAFFRSPQQFRRSWLDLSFAMLLVVLAAAWSLLTWLDFKIPLEHGGAVLAYSAFAAATFVFRQKRWLFAGILASAILVYTVGLAPELESGERLHVARNFFGVKKVIFEWSGNYRKLLHGDTMHGVEGLGPLQAGMPLSYYFPNGPFGDVMSTMSKRPGQRFGVVGLGSGTIAAYTQPNRHITFFEIDPQIEFIAKEFFTFLPRCGGGCAVVPGDGRLSILRSPDAEFDLLVLDAFNSDGIPAHLLSREALDIYVRKLKPDGAVLFHVSNRYLRVRDLVSSLVTEAGLYALIRDDKDAMDVGRTPSVWIVAAPDPEALGGLPYNRNWKGSL